jgi:hypothetical protein
MAALLESKNRPEELKSNNGIGNDPNTNSGAEQLAFQIDFFGDVCRPFVMNWPASNRE